MLSWLFPSGEASSSHLLRLDNINAQVKRCQYDVRGEIYLAAVKRAEENKEVIYTNVGNPHAVGEMPLTFIREVLSLMMFPSLLKKPNVSQLFASDAIARAKNYLRHINGGLGAYSDSRGHAIVRKEVADFISARDSIASDPNNIFLSNGASECVRMVLNVAISGPNDGVMVPIPQYPLYSASIALYGGQLVGYYLDEDNSWALDIGALQEALDSARSKSINVKAMVFINPGNPTGACLTADNLRAVLQFCYANRLVLLADEVYQENVYNPKRPFVSSRAALSTMPEEVQRSTELISFHTVSKGPYGECGLRGGYMELYNIDQDVKDQMYKLASINLSPNIIGQVALGLMVNPPRPGDASHSLFAQERNQVIQSLKRRAKMMTEMFNSLEGVTCQETEGAMYSFPRIELPTRFVEYCSTINKSPDVQYCLELLNETGLSCVPGSGFKQRDGTFHFRTTILPKEKIFGDILSRFTSFHKGFMRRYSGSTSNLKSRL